MILLLFICLFLCSNQALAAENLKLREGISYVHDLDKGFPILGDKLEDVRIESGRPCFIFFGAAGDLNTNRQSKRVIDLYKKYRDTNLKFIVIDVDHAPTPDAKQLIKRHYQGYIPEVVVLDKAGRSIWSHVGEVDNKITMTQLDKVVD
ncbi:MAG: hypothetical protein K2W82_19670 [Candidatus Obscuribacterales bacterium]|nr:hypothetical protein [Candidatus Obscuribacterales bacterium]